MSQFCLKNYIVVTISDLLHFSISKKKKKCLGILRPLISFYYFERSRNIISNPVINISIL